MSAVIDVHCHILHADAVEIDSFVKAYAGSAFPLKPPLLDIALGLLKYAVKLRLLPGLCDLVTSVGAFSTTAAPATLNELAKALDRLDAGLALNVRRLAEDLAKGRASPDALLPSDLPKLNHICQFAKVFIQPKEKIPEELIASYPRVQLFVPLMTDYEEWLAGEPAWKAWDDVCEGPFLWWCLRWRRSRVAYKKQLIVQHRGRLHLFAPFCPLRAAARGIAQEVDKAVGLILHDGFLGVKLYPIMGYYPCDNATRSKPEWLPHEAVKQGVTWAKVDEALNALYAACASNAVPITAHTSPAGARGPNGPDPADTDSDPGKRHAFYGTANQSHPYNWLPVLTAHPNLRLNLAHMGGDHFQTLRACEVDTEFDWAHATVEVMKQFAHVYADRSVQVPPDGSDSIAAYATRLGYVLDKAPALVPSRLMFGTDWHLVLLYYDYADCRDVLNRFDQVLAEPCIPSGFADRFYGANAAEFLGINPGGPALARLDSFYAAHFGTFRPDWWDQV